MANSSSPKTIQSRGQGNSPVLFLFGLFHLIDTQSSHGLPRLMSSKIQHERDEPPLKLFSKRKEESGRSDKPRKKRRFFRPRNILAAVALLVAAAFAVHHFFFAAQGAANITYQDVEVQRRDISVTLSGTGTVQPINQYEVVSLVQGEILECNCEEGDEVNEGDLL